MIARKRCEHSLAAILAFLLVQSWGPAAADVRQPFRAGAWSGSAYVDGKTRRFERCEATTSNSKQISITYSISRSFLWTLSFSDPSWKFSPGSRLDLVLRLNEKESLRTRAIVREAHVLEVQLEDSIGTFERLRTGGVLQVRAGGLVIDFDLRDSAEALFSLVDCARRNVSSLRSAEQRKRRPSAPSNTRSREAIREEASQLVSAIATFAQISDLRPAPMAEAAGIAADVVWKSQNVIGTVAIHDSVVEKYDEWSQSLVLAASRACQGRLFAAALPDAVDRISILRVVTICQTAEATVSIYQLGVPRPRGGRYVLGTATNGVDYGLFGRQPAGELAQKIRFVIGNVLRKLEPTRSEN